jgi:hypothetical protein
MNQLETFKKSFKIDTTLIKIILFDLLFYAITIPSFILMGIFLNKKSQGIDLAALNQNILAKSAEEVQLLATQMQNYFISFIGAIILAIIIVLAAWSLSRGLIYTNLLKKRLTWKYFFKTMGLNLLFAIIAIILLVFFSVLVQAIMPSVNLFLLVALIIIYFIMLSMIYFTETGKVFKGIGKAFSQGGSSLPYILLAVIGFALIRWLIHSILQNFIISPITASILSLIAAIVLIALFINLLKDYLKKITIKHKFVLPVLLILVVFFIASIITTLLSLIQIALITYVSWLIFIIFLAWTRIYLVKAAE